MTRKDYILLADAFSSSRPLLGDTLREYEQWMTTLLNLMDRLSKDNPRFDRLMFMKAALGV